jgi:hypothetical protein
MRAQTGLWIAGVIVLAAAAGYLAALAVIEIARAILPPFQPDDDDTLREFAPVALAYATWVLTSLAVVVVAARWRRRRR